MKTLRKFIEERFYIPFEMLLPEGVELFPMDNRDINEARLVGSEAATKQIFLAQGDIDRFIKSCPAGYFLLGHWGHGINSHAFYFSKVDDWSRVLFRLPYGGFYMDRKETAKAVRDFLLNYFLFENEAKNSIESLIAVDSFWEGIYRIVMKDGRRIEHTGSLYRHPQFSRILLDNEEPIEKPNDKKFPEALIKRRN